MNTYWPVRPSKSSMSRCTCSGVKATKSTTTSKRRRPSALRTEAGSRMSAVSTFAPAGAGRSVVRPRFRMVSCNPCATAAALAAALMVPVRR